MNEKVKRFLKNSCLPGEIPPMSEVIRALESPEAADPKVIEYLEARPDLKENLQEILRMTPGN